MCLRWMNLVSYMTASPSLEEFYLIGGGCVVLLSVLVWRNLEERNRRYLYLIIAGLGVSVFGAEILDKNPWYCGEQLQIFSLDCMRFHPLEEVFEKLGAFFLVMSLLGFAAAYIPREHWRWIRRSLVLSFSLPTLALLTVITLVNIRLGVFDPVILNFTFFHQTDFANGYHLDATIFPQTGTLSSEQNLFVTIHGEVQGEIEQDFGYAIHFVDQENQTVYAAHEHWSRLNKEQWQQVKSYGDPQKIWIPENVPAGRAMWLVFSLWEELASGEFANIPITSSDAYQLSETHIVLRDFILGESIRDFLFGESFILRDVGIPVTARAGELLVIPMTWEAVTDGETDWVQFMHFVHEETGALWNHDQQPLGARLPTRFCYEGLRDTEAWQIVLPADLAPGRYAIYTGLYRLSDLARLPARDENGVALPEARVPLGYLTIRE